MGRFFVPEVLQSSEMDCGPAALKAVLNGFGLGVNYERLREACNTGADGTSIDTLEEIADGLGLDASQQMVALDDAIDVLERSTPCLAVVQSVSGAPHFVVVWRVAFGFVQLMDPARGRVFVRASDFLQSLHVHEQAFETEDFAAWWQTTEWFRHAQRRLAAAGKPQALDPSLGVARLGLVEGAARVIERLVARGALPRRGVGDTIDAFVAEQLGPDPGVLPESQIVIREDPDRGQVTVRGALFLAIHPPSDPAAAPPRTHAGLLGDDGPSGTRLFITEVLLKNRGVLVALSLMSVLATLLALGEMVMVRAAFNARSLLSLPQQRVVATVLYAAVVVLFVVLDTALNFGILQLGRNAELRLRLLLLAKLPRLPDHYFRSRSMSDVTHRSQGLFQVKALPEVAMVLLKHGVDILVTVTALCLVFPQGTPLALMIVVVGVVAPAWSIRARQRVESRVQTHSSSLAQLYLEVLLGLAPLRAHGAQRAIRAKQDEYLVDWRRESQRAVSLLSATEAGQGLGTLLFVALFMYAFVRGADASARASLLLVAFWALRLPLLTRAFCTSLQRLPAIRASLHRLVEPLTAPETTAPREDRPAPGDGAAGLAIDVRDLTVTLGTSTVLSQVTVSIASGERVAIVGSSGSGKSMFVSCLLGLMEKTEGDIRFDGVPQAQFDVARLRRETIWVDTSVQLWNRSLLENLTFGNPTDARTPLHPVIDAVELKDLLERLPEGLASALGESGARVSGGEGQRVRTGRALLRASPRLVLLDEAFRSLDRPMRRRFSKTLRERVGAATVVEVTHDVADTTDADRILVIENGALVENDTPQALLSKASRYAELVAADRAVEADVWSANHWHQVRVRKDGQVGT